MDLIDLFNGFYLGGGTIGQLFQCFFSSFELGSSNSNGSRVNELLSSSNVKRILQ